MSEIVRFLSSGRCPISIVRRVGTDSNLPDNRSKTAVVDPQDLHLFGLRFRLKQDSRFVTTIPMVPSMLLVLKDLVQ